MKNSFTVFIGDHTNRTIVITGVTSMMPNLNGFLFNTEDREGFQIEKHELVNGGISNISFEYDYTEDDIEDLRNYPQYEIHDHKVTV